MPKVTIEFHIRVDDESIVNHSVEYERLYSGRTRISAEQEFAIDTVNRMEQLCTVTKYSTDKWQSLFNDA